LLPIPHGDETDDTDSGQSTPVNRHPATKKLAHADSAPGPASPVDFDPSRDEGMPHNSDMQWNARDMFF
jgi:hypothetical protein